MAFDFPTTPVLDQIYTSVDGITFAWDGQAWMKGSGSGTVAPPPTFPTPPAEDGLALVTLSSAAVWGAPINSGNF